jgi:hypothetical protein
MNLRDELSEWSYREVTTTLSVGECNFLKESITQFINERKQEKNDYFKQNFSTSVNMSDLSRAFTYFIELEKDNDDFKVLKDLLEKKKKNSDGGFDTTIDISLEETDDFFGFELMNQIGEASSKRLTCNLALNSLVAALRVNEAYRREVNFRDSEEISLHESDDWIPPSNFEHGTDDEKEVWKNFQKSQNSRK